MKLKFYHQEYLSSNMYVALVSFNIMYKLSSPKFKLFKLYNCGCMADSKVIQIEILKLSKPFIFLKMKLF